MDTKGPSPSIPLLEVWDIRNAFISKELFASARRVVAAPRQVGEHRVRCHLYPEDATTQES